MRKLVLFIILSFITGVAWGYEKDYDKVCSYFEELKLAEQKNKFTKNQRRKFISERIEKNIQPDSPARQAWELVLYGEPKVRYELFITSAEEVIRKHWQCPVMKELIPITGDE